MHNVDQIEIDKFSSSAAHWWDLEGEFKTLHQINPIRLDYINSRTPLAHQNVIDIGCGGGILTESMAALGAHVTGIDMSKAALDVAKLHQLESGLKIDYFLSTAEEMAVKKEQAFDIVTCMEMLEHVPDPLSVIQACAMLVKPGGHVYFSTINRNMKAYLFAIVGAEYVLNLLPKQTHDYAKLIRPSELAEWARKSGLSLQHLSGISYNVFNKKFSISEDISVNYMGEFVRI